MLRDLPASDHASKNIHEDTNIDEATLEPDVGNITDPDLIASADVKVLIRLPQGCGASRDLVVRQTRLMETERLASFINRATRL